MATVHKALGRAWSMVELEQARSHSRTTTTPLTSMISRREEPLRRCTRSGVTLGCSHNRLESTWTMLTQCLSKTKRCSGMLHQSKSLSSRTPWPTLSSSWPRTCKRKSVSCKRIPSTSLRSRGSRTGARRQTKRARTPSRKLPNSTANSNSLRTTNRW